MTGMDVALRQVESLGEQAWPAASRALREIVGAPHRRPSWLSLSVAVGAALLLAAPLAAVLTHSMVAPSRRPGHGPVGVPASAAAGVTPSPPAGVTTPGVALSGSGGGGQGSPSTPPATGTSGDRHGGGGGSAGPGATQVPPPSPSAAPGQCGTSALSVVAVADRSSYTLGQVVNITLTATNVSSTTCWVPAGGGCSSHFTHGEVAEVYDAQGNLVWDSLLVCTGATYVERALAPGGSTSDVFSWSQEDCRQTQSCAAAPPAARGTYQVGGNWPASGGGVEARRQTIQLQ